MYLFTPDSKEFLESFRKESIPSFLTNSFGVILEANQAGADLLETSPAHLKNKMMRWLFADRKRSIQRFDEMRAHVSESEILREEVIILRTQPDKSKRKMIRANMVVHALNNEILIWKFIDIDILPEDDELSCV